MTDGVGLQIEDRGHVRHLRLRNPSRRNALTRPMLAALGAALPAGPAGEGQPIRAVVLSGDPDGRAFSAGFDLTAIDDAERARGLDPIRGPAEAIEACPVPVIAAIEGPAFGGALELACACDARVAARGSTLCMPPARLGLVYSATGVVRFLRLLTPGAARRLFLTAQVIGAEEAMNLGLIEQVTEPGGAEAEALRWAEAIAANAPLAVAGLREAIRCVGRAASLSESDADLLAALRDRAVHSEDLQEGLRAFREKRPPAFRGR